MEGSDMVAMARVAGVAITLGALVGCEPSPAFPVAVPGEAQTPTAPGANEPAPASEAPACRIDSLTTGTPTLDWGLQFPATGTSTVAAFTYDSDSNIIATLGHEGTLELDGSTYSPNGCYDHLHGFVAIAKFTPSGRLLWIKRPPPPATCMGVLSLTVDAAKRIWILGVENARTESGRMGLRRFLLRLSPTGVFEERRELEMTPTLIPVEGSPELRFWSIASVASRTVIGQVDASLQGERSFEVDGIEYPKVAFGSDGAVAIAGARDDGAMRALRVERRRTEGDLVWAREFPLTEDASGASRGFVKVNAIALGADGSTYAAISFAGTLRLGEEEYRYGGITANFVPLLFKLDPSGAPAWVRTASRDYAPEQLGFDAEGNLVSFGSAFDDAQCGTTLQHRDAPKPTLMRMNPEDGAVLSAFEVAAYGVQFRPGRLSGLLMGGILGAGETFGMEGDGTAGYRGFLLQLPPQHLP